jgi:hypothetical protein
VNKIKVFFICLVLLSSFFLQSCVFVPILDSIKDTGVTAGQRQALLPKAVSQFQDARGWRDSMAALALIDEEVFLTVKPKVLKALDHQRIVDFKIIDIKSDEDIYQSVVKASVRYFEEGTYIVKTSEETQTWVFSIGNGWRLKDISGASI